jgi:hypothetical protein
MPTKHKLVPLLLALLVVLSGCAGFGGSGGDGGDAASSLDGGDGGDGGSGGSGADSGAPAGDGGQQQAVSSTESFQSERAIIRTGTVRLRVEQFDAARSALTNRARGMGGYVGGSGETQHTEQNTTWSSGYLVVRVPAEQFTEMLSSARERGTVLSEETSTKDVTDRLVDIEARMTNLEDRRARLRAFYDRANTTEELLRIEERLSNVQGQIEQLEAEKRSLKQKVAYATLRIELRERHDTPKAAANDSQQSLGGAFFGSIGTIVDIGEGTALVLAGAAPYLLVFGLPALLVYQFVRRRNGVEATLAADDEQ